MEDRDSTFAGMYRYPTTELPEGGEEGSEYICQLNLQGKLTLETIQAHLRAAKYAVCRCACCDCRSISSGTFPGFLPVLAGTFIIVFSEGCGEMLHR